MTTILYISHTSRMGGAEHSLLILLERLDRSAYEPVVAVPEPGPLVDRLDALGIRSVTVPLGRLERTWNPVRLAQYWRMWCRARTAIDTAIRGVNASLVHSNSTTAHLFAHGAAQAANVPCVWHVRDMSSPGGLPDKWMTRAAAAIIPVSNAVKDRLAHPDLAREKTTVVHNGVDTAAFSPGDGGPVRRELGLSNSVPLAGVVGQMVPWKGLDRFLEAAALACKRVPEARFVVAGDNRFGDFPRALQDLKFKAAQLGIADKTFFLGWRDDVVAIMRALDVLVLPSQDEPFGRVVIEAMACGKPVIAFRSGGPPEIIEDSQTGLLVDPGDAARLAGAMVRILSNPDEAAVMGSRSRARACEQFSAERYVRDIQSLYERLLGRSPAH